jgi:predicted lipoprotein
MNKILKYVLIIVAILLLVYFSLKIENLEEYKARTISVKFNASDFSASFWKDDIPKAIDEAPEFVELYRMIDENPEKAFAQFGHKLGISRTGYFFVKGSGIIESVEEEYLVLNLNEQITVRLATEYIFGNAVRDGSGMVNINDFLNMTDFNSTSVEINKHIKEKVIPRLVNIADQGKTIEFTGAAEIIDDQIELDSLIIIPVKVNLINGNSK